MNYSINIKCYFLYNLLFKLLLKLLTINSLRYGMKQARLSFPLLNTGKTREQTTQVRSCADLNKSGNREKEKVQFY